MKAKYVNPFTDFGFKKIFGEEQSKSLLIDFLNALLPPTRTIRDLSFKNTEQLGYADLDRKAIYDIYCEARSGERFIVELQKAKQNYFIDRTVYYYAFPKGRTEGFQKGIEQGIEKSKIETAKKLKEKGIDANLIIEITGLTKNEIDLL